MKNVVKFYKDFFGYFNALKPHGVPIPPKKSYQQPIVLFISTCSTCSRNFKICKKIQSNTNFLRAEQNRAEKWCRMGWNGSTIRLVVQKQIGVFNFKICVKIQSNMTFLRTEQNRAEQWRRMGWNGSTIPHRDIWLNFFPHFQIL